MFAMMMRNPAHMLFLFTTAALAYLVLPPLRCSARLFTRLQE